MTVLIGKQKLTRKDGGTAYILHFSESMYDENSEGEKAFNEYIKGDYGHLGVGQEVNLIYRKGFQDKAFLIDVN